MKVTTERKLVTLNVTAQEMDKINSLDFVNVGDEDSILDLDTYYEFVEEEHEIVEEIIKTIEDANVEADVVQFFLG